MVISYSFSPYRRALLDLRLSVIHVQHVHKTPGYAVISLIRIGRDGGRVVITEIGTTTDAFVTAMSSSVNEKMTKKTARVAIKQGFSS